MPRPPTNWFMGSVWDLYPWLGKPMLKGCGSEEFVKHTQKEH